MAAAEKIPIPAGICYEQTEISSHPQVRAGEMIAQVNMPDGLGPMPVTNTPVRLSATPPQIERSFPAVGQHNNEVYGEILGFTPEYIEELKAEGVI
jgi:formyl-CoA transferase